MNQLADIASPVAPMQAPSLKVAFLGFFASTMLTCSVMVLLSSL